MSLLTGFRNAVIGGAAIAAAYGITPAAAEEAGQGYTAALRSSAWLGEGSFFGNSIPVNTIEGCFNVMSGIHANLASVRINKPITDMNCVDGNGIVVAKGECVGDEPCRDTSAEIKTSAFRAAELKQ